MELHCELSLALELDITICICGIEEMCNIDLRG